MMNEHKVQASIDQIESSSATSLRKARQLLSIARKLRKTARHLSGIGEYFYLTGDPLRGARFAESNRRLLRTRRDARNSAAKALRQPAPALRFQYAPRVGAYPSWRTSEEKV